MKPGDIDWLGGKVVYWDLDFLCLAGDIDVQIDGLKEDLAQIAYSPDVVLDLGWYPEFSVGGAFSVRVVVRSDWDDPVWTCRVACLRHLRAALSAAALVASDLCRP